ncbi:transcriptional regulator [Reticulibacter mediterranei]|uniref:Transcriptional regulator n=1 Tax=Reticulibacter mediterranei TaxID=2778369 RepID=A0A8J3N892_9CHLR|nr:tetratricopeptide repeat protein [Reticulibacter mediterranei]GHO99295.1 transcriptional regulator [Reticulibacter mediterranei]
MLDFPTGTITLLFTDIEGSTRLLRQLGDEYSELLTSCRTLLRNAVQEQHGYEVDTQGDAIFAVFARANDALSAATAAQRALAAYAWPQGVQVRVRMGLHTGEPARVAEGYVGLDVHRAARIMSAAHGGQVLLSRTTRDLVVNDEIEGVSLRDLGEYRLKDFEQAASLYQVVIAGLPADFPPLKTLDSRADILPVPPTALVGREDEVAHVGALLRRDDVRLVTLSGPGGTGKSRLSLQVAAKLRGAFTGGIFFVSLAPITDPMLVLPVIAQVLGIRDGIERDLMARVVETLQRRAVLLVLDNFEQVIGAAEQVGDLLASCQGLKILVTSREVLHVRAEYEFAVPPLELPDPAHLPALEELASCSSVALFVQRVQAVKPEFRLTTANAREIAEICVRLDGLPLAIELAAARMKLLSPQALLARMGKRLALLTGGARDVPARQQTLRNTISWSYHLLNEQEQRLFRWLSVFVGSCALSCVEAMCTRTGNDMDDITSLVDKSLLRPGEQTEEESGEEPRLLMLETIREYGLEMLTTSGEATEARQWHAEHFLQLTEEAVPALDGPLLTAWLNRLEQEHDNLRAALHWLLSTEFETDASQVALALRLAAALERFWVVRGYRNEGLTFLERALRESAGVAPAVRAKALLVAARLTSMQSDYERSKELAQESLALFRELQDKRGIALSLNRLGIAAWRQADFATARVLMEEDLALYRELENPDRIAWSLFALGLLNIKQGEYARAAASFQESLALFRKLANKRGIAASLTQTAATLFLSQGEQTMVYPLLSQGLALDREVGDKEGMAVTSLLLGSVALKQGDFATARTRIEEALRLYREMGYQEGIAEALALLGKVETARGDLPYASTLYEESIAMARELNQRELLAIGLERLAPLRAVQGDPAQAARLWGLAEALREALGAPLPPVERTDYDAAVAAVRHQLGEQVFVSTWQEGRLLPVDQALPGAATPLSPQQKRQIVS